MTIISWLEEKWNQRHSFVRCALDLDTGFNVLAESLEDWTEAWTRRRSAKSEGRSHAQICSKTGKQGGNTYPGWTYSRQFAALAPAGGFD